MDGLGGEGATDFDEDMPEFGGDDTGSSSKKQKTETEKKVYMNSKDGLGKSTSGRNAWKERHRKGKFSGRKKRSERKFKDPLGI